MSKEKETKSQNVEQPVAQETSKMEKPATADYDKVYTISKVFIDDLKTCLGDMEFNKAEQFIRFAEAKKDGIITAELQEFINKLGYLPWRYISPLMQAMGSSEIMAKYFVEKDDK